MSPTLSSIAAVCEQVAKDGEVSAVEGFASAVAKVKGVKEGAPIILLDT